jgi:hypothetical protein
MGLRPGVATYQAAPQSTGELWDLYRPDNMGIWNMVQELISNASCLG